MQIFNVNIELNIGVNVIIIGRKIDNLALKTMIGQI